MVAFKPLTTTVIGSFPIQVSNREAMSSFYRTQDPFLKSIELSIKDQLETGIDIISDGQTRGNMVKIFTDRIIGFESDSSTATAVDKLSYPSRGITLQDQMHALNLIKDRDAKLKGILTGPSTILNTVKPGVYKTRSRELLFDIAEVLKQEAKELEKTGLFYIQIDEPIFSVKPENLEDSITALNIITQNLTIPVGLHVCGSLKGLFPKILDLKNFPIFHIESKSNPENLEIIKEYKPDMHIGLGVVKNLDERVESVEEIKQFIENALKFLDPNKLIINPDCGMRNLSRESAINKLKNIVKAKEEIKKERGL